MTDKPAATGNGEPSESERDLAAARQNVLYIVNNAIGYIPDGFIDALAHYVEKVEKHYHPNPTPPASQPTVTRTRDEELDELATYIALRLPEYLPLRGDRAEAKRVILALLRAAEQK